MDMKDEEEYLAYLQKITTIKKELLKKEEEIRDLITIEFLKAGLNSSKPKLAE